MGNDPHGYEVPVVSPASKACGKSCKKEQPVISPPAPTGLLSFREKGEKLKQMDPSLRMNAGYHLRRWLREGVLKEDMTLTEVIDTLQPEGERPKSLFK